MAPRSFTPTNWHDVWAVMHYMDTCLDISTRKPTKVRISGSGGQPAQLGIVRGGHTLQRLLQAIILKKNVGKCI
jgi:hypothetical protein